MKKPISRKQEAFLLAKHKRINLLSGSVRSGKTYVSLLAWALFVAAMPKSSEFLMVGKTVTALMRNCLNLLVELVGSNNFSYSFSRKQATLFGRCVWLEGANDERSETKIRGMTLAGAYCDELTLFPESFYMMLLSRLSVEGAQLFATTNPDSPVHWVKTAVIDNVKIQSQLDHWHFTLDDNDYNDPQYVEDLKAVYTGVFYDRYILGLWTRADGLVYPHAKAAETPTVDRVYTEWQVAIDYGIHNPTCFGLFGKCDGTWYMVKEYYHSGRASRQPKTDEEYLQELIRFIGDIPVRQVIVDPSASSFITLIRRNARLRVRNAKNDVIDGIRHTASWLANGVLRINDCCVHTIAEFAAYAWDDRATEDKPIKESDHCMDLIRYFAYTNARSSIEILR